MKSLSFVRTNTLLVFVYKTLFLDLFRLIWTIYDVDDGLGDMAMIKPFLSCTVFFPGNVELFYTHKCIHIQVILHVKTKWEYLFGVARSFYQRKKKLCLELAFPCADLEEGSTSSPLPNTTRSENI